MYKVIIFDLDGTIADTAQSIATAGNKALIECGLDPRDVQEYKQFAGDGADVLIKRMLEAAGDKQGIHYEKAMESYQHFFKKDCIYKVKPYDGIKTLLDFLKEIGIKIAVLSNKPHDRAVMVVESLFGKAYFDIILGQQGEIPKKPDPSGALLIAKNFGVSPRECIYVGDTDVDMQTGNSAGMYTVGVLWGFRDRKELEENDAHVLVHEPKEIGNLII